MYAQYFGLRELPFNNTPDPRFFYSTPDHEEALASLIYAVQERKGFVLLTGEIGAGKTLVSRMMLRHFGTMIAFATINHAVEDGRDLLESICTEFELRVEPGTSRTNLVRLLHDFLLSKFAQNHPVVLVLDEAQNLSSDSFEQLRMIGNLEADDAKLLQIVIVGQPELQQRFASPKFCQLRQRIFRNFHLPAMNRQTTEGYIHHRLSVAGAENLSRFTTDAMDRIYEFSRGVPRIINTLCDNAMLSAYSADRGEIDGPAIQSVVEQMMVTQATADETSHAFAAADRTAPGSRATTDTPKFTPPSVVVPSGASPPKAPAPRPRIGGPRPRPQAPRRPAVWATPLSAQQDRVNAESAALLSQVKCARAALEPLVHRAESLVTRAQLAVDDLARREERLRSVDRTVSVVVRELRGLLDRAQRATSPRPHRPRGAAGLGDTTAPRDERLLKSVEAGRERIEGFQRRAAQLRSLLDNARLGVAGHAGATTDTAPIPANEAGTA